MANINAIYAIMNTYKFRLIESLKLKLIFYEIVNANTIRILQ